MQSVDFNSYNNDWYRKQIGASRLKQLLWYFTNVLFFINPLNPSSGLKVRLIRAFGANTGKNIVIKPGVNIKYPWLLSIGDNCWIGEKVWIDNLTTIKIGDNVCLSQGSMLLTGNHNYNKASFDLIVRGIILENGVWIGANAVVCPGVTCLSHSVLAVSSVANSNLKAYTIYQGNPAVVLRKGQSVHDGLKMKKVTFVNKFGPGSNAVTGQNARELADYLFQQGIDIEFVCLKGDYITTGKAGNLPLHFPVSELSQSYTGRSPALRLLAGLWDGLRLWMASRRTRADFILVMTDPPLLFFWFQLFSLFSKSRLIYRTMDLYPEAFVAGGYVKASNPVYRFFHFIVYRKAPNYLIVLGREQLSYLEKKFRQKLAAVVVPAGIINDYDINYVQQPDAEKITFGYSGNIGEAHDADFLIALANAFDPEKHQFILRGYGAKAEQVKSRIAGKPGVYLRDYLSLQEIAGMDINVASLLPKWNHICVPSKAVTAISLGSSILLNASQDADNWQMFKDASWLVAAGTDYEAQVKKLLSTITREEILRKKTRAVELAADLALVKQRSFVELADFISKS